MLMFASFIAALKPNFACKFVKTVGTLCRDRCYDFFFGLIRNLKKVTCVGMCALKCVCVPYLLTDSYPILYISSLMWQVVQAANGFLNFC